MSNCKVNVNKQDTRKTVKEQMEAIQDTLVVVHKQEKQKKVRKPHAKKEQA